MMAEIRMADPTLMMRVLNGQRTEKPPIWLMRQAGRYLPEYLATRADAGSFLDLCYDTKRATEVSMQPIRRFDFDAAILFADILLVPHALGRRVWFETGEGPRLDPLRTLDEVHRLSDDDTLHQRLAPVYATVAAIRSSLSADKSLIGFAGAPWTVATYVVAGRGKDGQQGAKSLMLKQPDIFAALMQRLEEATISYLSRQIDAGADVVKLFDSWAGALADDTQAFNRWCLEPARRIIAALRARHPGTPVIAFPRGAGIRYAEFAAAVAAAAIAIDETIDPKWAHEALQPHAAVQGNLDPKHLVGDGKGLEAAVHNILAALSVDPMIFNLGHGITPDANPLNVERLVRLVRG